MYTVYMPDFSRRSIILGTAGVAAAGAGVTAAASGLSGSVEGQADVQAEQALTVNAVDITTGDEDADFKRVSDDNTEFQVAVELNNGDGVLFDANVENSAADDLDVQVNVDSPDPIDIDVREADGGISGTGSDDLDPDDNGNNSNAVQTGEGTFITTIGSGQADSIGIFAELDDTAEPGSYDIDIAINPLSTDN
jgi:hypothetical protein